MKGQGPLEEIISNSKMTRREFTFQMAPLVGLFRVPYAILKEKPTIVDEVLLAKSWYPLAYGIYQGLSILAIWYGVAYGTISLIR